MALIVRVLAHINRHSPVIESGIYARVVEVVCHVAKHRIA